MSRKPLRAQKGFAIGLALAPAADKVLGEAGHRGHQIGRFRDQLGQPHQSASGGREGKGPCDATMAGSWSSLAPQLF
jgi:hypothetical protein